MKNILSLFAQWLCMCFLFIAVLIASRIYYSGNTLYLFLVWNLFLAWLPYAISLYSKKAVASSKIIQTVIFICWLLFFPNALYIVTDIIHVKETETVPVWFDAILLFIASFTGIALAFASLVNMEKYLVQFFSKKYVQLVNVFLLFVGSFGVYLGRFQRWNSWDVLQNPINLAVDILHCFTAPFAHTKTWGITFLLTALYLVCWFFMKAITSINTIKNK